RYKCARSRGPLPNLRRCSAGGPTSGLISASCCLQGCGPMRTDDLINTLVADHAAQPRPGRVGDVLGMAIFGGLAISAAPFSVTLGPRPDILSSFSTWRFDMKWA